MGGGVEVTLRNDSHQGNGNSQLNCFIGVVQWYSLDLRARARTHTRTHTRTHAHTHTHARAFYVIIHYAFRVGL